jgi:serine/threonine-protein kinase HipA
VREFRGLRQGEPDSELDITRLLRAMMQTPPIHTPLMTEPLAVFLQDDYLGDVTLFARGRRHQKKRVQFLRRLYPPIATIVKRWPHHTAIDDTTAAQRLMQAVERHDLGLQDDSRSMLPGFQPKLLLTRFGSQWHEPHGRAHSTHILKPQLHSRPHQIYNEYYSHQLSRAMGLSQFYSEVISVGQTTFLCIERFDRVVDGTSVSLVHQEDAAQALGLDWQNSEIKFQDSRWPTNPARPNVRKIAEITGSLPNALTETAQWLRQLIFHVLIGDNDAHAKNVGFVHKSSGTRLSELDDAVPNLYQSGRISWDMAMAINGDFDQRKMSAESIAREASSWSVLRPDTINGVIEATLREFADAQASVQSIRITAAGRDPTASGTSGG